ncbi:hypothetical protein ACLOJK_034070 [Asimina triloba]
MIKALKYQIEVQRRLHEQLEIPHLRPRLFVQVQKKLQMRIEAQGKYLQAILEKAQRSLTSDVNGSGTLEATRAQLTDFNLALSGLMENMSQMQQERKGGDLVQDGLHNDRGKTTSSLLQLYQQGEEEQEKNQPAAKLDPGTGSTLFDLNMNSGYEFIGVKGCELNLMHGQG